MKEIADIVQKGLKLGFSRLTRAEKNKLPIKKFGWKEEGDSGPLFVEIDFKVEDKFMGGMKNAVMNYTNSSRKKYGSDSDEYFAAWYPRSKGEKIAREFGMRLEIY